MSSTPICRCRVLYMGSAVPHITKDGLHGIQEPLRELYPEEGVMGARGIDSWLSVWSNGLLLENVDEKQKRVTRFFPIESLHYCAAVRRVTIPGADGERVERFLPLDSPFARIPTANNPPLFACILRRTTGIKVLECHAFVAKKEMAANALVRCCFHAYADNMYAKRLEEPAGGNAGSVYGGSGIMAQTGAMIDGNGGGEQAVLQLLNGRGPANGAAPTSINPITKVEQWRAYVHANKEGGNGNHDNDSDDVDGGEIASIYDGDENHKVWTGNGALLPDTSNATDDQQSIYADFSSSTIRSVKSVIGNGTQRSNRPRQISAPASPPPPPPPPANTSTTNSKAAITGASNGTNNKMRTRKPIPNGVGPHHYPGHPTANQNSYHPHTMQQQRRPPGPEYQPPWLATGRKMRQGGPLPLPGMNGHHPGHQQSQIVPYGFPPPPPNMMAPLPPPPHLMGAFRPYPPGPPMMSHPSPGPRPKRGASAEEPVYLPSARPMSPVASYQPGAFPYEQYYLNQHHAPLNGSHYAHPQSQHPQSNGPQSGPPTPQPTSTLASSAKNTKYKKKKADKTSGSGGESGGNGSSTKFNTGIYRKKGHLNERAFSYSIRQEHRSRSHSSLATLNFNGPSNEPVNGIEVIDDDITPPTANGHYHHHYGVVTNGGRENHHNTRNVQTTTALVSSPPSNGHGKVLKVNGSAAKSLNQESPINGKGAQLQQQRSAPPPTKTANGSSKASGQKVAETNSKRQGSNGVNTNGSMNRMMNNLSLSDGELEEIVRAEHLHLHQPSMSRRKILAATNR